MIDWSDSNRRGYRPGRLIYGLMKAAYERCIRSGGEYAFQGMLQCVAAFPLSNEVIDFEKLAHVFLVIAENRPDDQRDCAQTGSAVPEAQQFIATVITEVEVKKNPVGKWGSRGEAFFEVGSCCVGGRFAFNV